MHRRGGRGQDSGLLWGKELPAAIAGCSFFCPFYFFRFLSFLFACISHSVSSRQVDGSLTLLACSVLCSPHPSPRFSTSFLPSCSPAAVMLSPPLLLVPYSRDCTKQVPMGPQQNQTTFARNHTQSPFPRHTNPMQFSTKHLSPPLPRENPSGFKCLPLAALIVT